MKLTKICLKCFSTFLISASRRGRAKYCSTQCQYAHQMKHKANFVKCTECNKKFMLPPSHAKRNTNTFCSRYCSAIYNKNLGDVNRANNFQWKGGITPIQVLIRTSAQYAKWRKSVFERDNYTCVSCGVRGGELNADHIKSFSQYPELRFELDNGRTLCIDCHRNTPNYAGRATVYLC